MQVPFVPTYLTITAVLAGTETEAEAVTDVVVVVVVLAHSSAALISKETAMQ